MCSSTLQIYQLRVGGFDDNFSYLLFDSASRDAALIDPCGDIAVIAESVRRIGTFNPKYILLTHGHRDHTSGVNAAKTFFNAAVLAHPECAFAPHRDLSNGESLPFGKIFIEVLFTPGHSSDSVCYHLSDDSAIFTGDTLFIDCCGYCSPEILFKTMREILYPLNDSNIIYSGHDYGAVPFAALGEQKSHNPFLHIEDFDQFAAAVKQL
jgi:hydroxyacylglutathione hydrolase